MCTLVDGMVAGGALRNGGKRVVVLCAPGDRRDEDIRALSRRAAKSFDYFICRRDDKRRGRGEDEVPRIIERELLAAGVAPDRITVIPSEVEAVDAALKMCVPGDLLLLFADEVTRSWKQVIYFGGREKRPEAHESPRAEPLAEPEMPAPPPSLFGRTLLRDARGVRLAAPEESD
jgi:cyanophycin synthetase